MAYDGKVDSEEWSNPLAPAEGQSQSHLLGFHNESTLDPCYLVEQIRRILPVPKHSQNGETQQLEEFSMVSALDKEFEDAGSALWDVAAIRETAVFLLDSPLPQVLTIHLSASASLDRVLELSLGILANLACHEGAASRLGGVEGLVDSTRRVFLTSEDPPTLTEAVRLWRVAVKSEAEESNTNPSSQSPQISSKPWSAVIIGHGGDGSGDDGEAIAITLAMLSKLSWILASATSAPLLQHTADLLSAILSANPQFGLEILAKDMMNSLVAGLAEALIVTTALGSGDDVAADAVLRALETLGSCGGDRTAQIITQHEGLITCLRHLILENDQAGGGPVGEVVWSALVVLSRVASDASEVDKASQTGSDLAATLAQDEDLTRALVCMISAVDLDSHLEEAEMSESEVCTDALLTILSVILDGITRTLRNQTRNNLPVSVIRVVIQGASYFRMLLSLESESVKRFVCYLGSTIECWIKLFKEIQSEEGIPVVVDLIEESLKLLLQLDLKW